jgi:hypothetical protein
MRIIRGYYIIGIDTLVHLGFIQRLATGFPVSRIFYPYMHVLVLELSLVTQLQIRETLFLSVVPFTLLLVTFVALTTREIATDELSSAAIKFGFLIGLCIFPINWLGTNLEPHPSSFAVFFSPVFYFLLFRGTASWTTSIAILLSVVSIALVFLHPMIAFLVVISLVGLGGTYLAIKVFKRAGDDSTTSSLLVVTGVCIFLGIVVVYYLVGTDAFQSTFVQTIVYITEPITAEGNPSDRAGRLSQIGRSAYVIALKFGGANAVAFVPFVIAIFLASSRLWSGKDYPADSTTVSIMGAMGALSGAVVVFLAAGQTFYFRVLGLVMVLYSIVASVGLHAMYTDTRWEGRRLLARAVPIVLVLVIVGFSLPLMHPSPYIASPSEHTTQAEVATAETAISYGVSSPVVTTREHFARLEFFITGEPTPIVRVRLADHFNNRDLPAEFNDGMYLFTTQSDYETDVILYKGFRFNERDFQYLDYETRMDRVITSGSASVYIVSK